MLYNLQGIGEKNPIAWILFAEWIRITSGNTKKYKHVDQRLAEVDKLLKGMGFHAYENGEGYPTLSHWYPGPFEVGQVFVWEPHKLRELIVIVDIAKRENDEDVIWSEYVNKTNKPNPEFWVPPAHPTAYPNEESRMREACVLPFQIGLDSKGNRLTPDQVKEVLQTTQPDRP